LSGAAAAPSMAENKGFFLHRFPEAGYKVTFAESS
jgi:hypothetical protein